LLRWAHFGLRIACILCVFAHARNAKRRSFSCTPHVPTIAKPRRNLGYYHERQESADNKFESEPKSAHAFTADSSFLTRIRPLRLRSALSRRGWSRAGGPPSMLSRVFPENFLFATRPQTELWELDHRFTNSSNYPSTTASSGSRCLAHSRIDFRFASNMCVPRISRVNHRGSIPTLLEPSGVRTSRTSSSLLHFGAL
jgi:hypothetical protein